MHGFPRQFGRYELLAEIGRGGMAELFLGRLTGIGGFAKLVAIKRMLPHLSQDAHFVEMFLNEGRIAARLAHPNVCQVFELGEVDGELFLAMEYLEGISLGDLLVGMPGDPYTRLRLAAAVIGQGCDGLAYAHELRDERGRATPVVHRDISPHNLFVTTDGVCKLLDFGVSKVISEVDQTRSGLVKGKLPYMPPEQVRGEQVDVRADVFSTGVVLWETLTGTRLFVRDSDFLIWRAVLEDPIPPLGRAYPAAMDDIIGRALERDRERRTPSVRLLADEVRRCVESVGAAFTAAEVGAFVRAHGADTLAQRARVVAAATVVTPPPMAAREAEVASITHSVELRDYAVRIGRRRQMWALVVVGVLAAGAATGVTCGVIARHGDPDAAPAKGVASAVIDAPAAITAPDAVGEAAAIELDPEPEPDPPAPAPAPEHGARARPHVVVVAPKEPGFFSIDSNPYATIFVDGKKIDQTPLFHLSLPAGRHAIRAVLADGRTRTLAVRIEPGKHVSSGTLSW